MQERQPQIKNKVNQRVISLLSLFITLSQRRSVYLRKMHDLQSK